MALRHIVDWESKNKNITTNVDNENWLVLKKKFDNKSVTRFDLMLYSLRSGNYNLTRRSINRLIRNDSLAIPAGELFTIHNNSVSLQTFLRQIAYSSLTHSAYALLAARLVCEMYKIPLTKFARLTIKEYNSSVIVGVDIILPKWLTTILDRQKRMALQIGMGDDDPLFFVMRWSDMKKTSLQSRAIRLNDPEITDTLYKFRIAHKYSVSDYIDKFVTFCGMPNNAILQVLPPEYTGTKFHSEKSIYGKLVTVYDYDSESKRRIVRTFGYLVWAHNGLYLIHSNEGFLWCPYYLLGEPTVRKDRIKDNNLKLDLHKLGYYPIEFYENIKDHKMLRNHTITRKVIASC